MFQERLRNVAISPNSHGFSKTLKKNEILRNKETMEPQLERNSGAWQRDTAQQNSNNK